MSQSLKHIFWKNRTGKKEHKYHRFYETILDPHKDNVRSVLEIGSNYGYGLNAWKEYFPNAQIYGIDRKEKYRIEKNRIKTFIGDYQDVEFMEGVLDEIGIPEVVIDDCDHNGQHMLNTFQLIFPRMQSGTWYFLEDMRDAKDPIMRDYLSTMTDNLLRSRRHGVGILYVFRKMACVEKL